MSDPAILAAQRAIDGPHGVAAARDEHAAPLAVDAAREALAPIRDLHKPSANHCDAHANDSACCAECIECGQLWPCDTARLIYTSEELNQ